MITFYIFLINYIFIKSRLICFRMVEWCLKYKVVARCSTSKARASVMSLDHGDVETPVFMPVGTQGTMKGITTDQLRKMGQ